MLCSSRNLESLINFSIIMLGEYGKISGDNRVPKEAKIQNAFWKEFTIVPGLDANSKESPDDRLNSFKRGILFFVRFVDSIASIFNVMFKHLAPLFSGER